MALTDHDLSELLAALKAGEMTDTVRTSLEWILQQLIEAEVTAVIGAGPHEPLPDEALADLLQLRLQGPARWQHLHAVGGKLLRVPLGLVLRSPLVPAFAAG